MKLVFLVRPKAINKTKMKKSIHNQTSFRQISLEIVLKSKTLTILSAFQKLKRRFKIQRLNDSLFAIKINLLKKHEHSYLKN